MPRISNEVNPHERHKQKIISAMERGDIEGAKAALDTFSNAVVGAYADKLHHLGVALEYILEKLGEDAIADVWRRSFRDLNLSELYSRIGQDPGELISYWEKLGDRISSATPDSTCVISETEETLSLELSSCPSGGVYRRKGIKGFAYPGLERGWKTMEGKHPWTLNESGLVPYCVHCGVLNEIFKENGALIEFQYGKEPSLCPLQVPDTQTRDESALGKSHHREEEFREETETS